MCSCRNRFETRTLNLGASEEKQEQFKNWVIFFLLKEVLNHFRFPHRPSHLLQACIQDLYVNGQKPRLIHCWYGKTDYSKYTCVYEQCEGMTGISLSPLWSKQILGNTSNNKFYSEVCGLYWQCPLTVCKPSARYTKKHCYAFLEYHAIVSQKTAPEKEKQRFSSSGGILIPPSGTPESFSPSLSLATGTNKGVILVPVSLNGA